VTALAAAEAQFGAMLDGDLADAEIAEILTELHHRGETAEEIAGAVRAMRARMKRVAAPEGGIDVCGTGGDGQHSVNVSTAVALVVSACGVPVAKHGNRAATSRCGSADVLEALGIPIDLRPEQAARALREQGFAFFFAPSYHPAFKHVAPARKLCAERGGRTLFNLLGPLLNPARPSAVLAGVPLPELCEPLAKVLQSLGIRRGMVVCGTVAGFKLDELSTLGENTVAEFYHERGFTTSGLSLENFPLQSARLEDLLGSDKFQNAEITRRILRGAERGPKRDAVLLNAGAALFVAGKTKSLAEGWELAGETIDSGAAEKKLAQLAS